MPGLDTLDETMRGNRRRSFFLGVTGSLLILCAVLLYFFLGTRPTGFETSRAESPSSLPQGEERIAQVRDLVRAAKESYGNVRGYEAEFQSKSFSESETPEIEKAFFKFAKPFTIYFRWTEGGKNGLQLFYASGKYDDKLFAKLPGIFLGIIPPVPLSLNDPILEKAGAHSILRAGVGYLIEDFEETFEKLAASKRLSVLAVKENFESEGERGTLVDVHYHDPAEKYPRQTILFSAENHLPIEIRLHRERAQPSEIYRYANLRLNAPVTSDEFRKHTHPNLYDKFVASSS